MGNLTPNKTIYPTTKAVIADGASPLKQQQQKKKQTPSNTVVATTKPVIDHDVSHMKQQQNQESPSTVVATTKAVIADDVCPSKQQQKQESPNTVVANTEAVMVNDDSSPTQQQQKQKPSNTVVATTKTVMVDGASPLKQQQQNQKQKQKPSNAVVATTKVVIADDVSLLKQQQKQESPNTVVATTKPVIIDAFSPLKQQQKPESPSTVVATTKSVMVNDASPPKKAPPPQQDTVHTPPSTIIIIDKPHDNDVLFGRGAAATSHKGNRRYRNIIKANRHYYSNAPKFTKKTIAEAIVKVTQQRGRFLRQDKNSNSQKYFWVEVPFEQAVNKTSQSLRERGMNNGKTKIDNNGKTIDTNESGLPLQQPQQQQQGVAVTCTNPTSRVSITAAATVVDINNRTRKEDSTITVVDNNNRTREDQGEKVAKYLENKYRSTKKYISVGDKPASVDVICACGDHGFHHFGNRRYYLEILLFRKLYKKCDSDDGRSKIAKNMLSYVQNILGGRFLKIDKSCKRWFVLIDEFVLEKTKNFLNDDYIPSWAKGSSGNLDLTKATRIVNAYGNLGSPYSAAFAQQAHQHHTMTEQHRMISFRQIPIMQHPYQNENQDENQHDQQAPPPPPEKMKFNNSATDAIEIKREFGDSVCIELSVVLKKISNNEIDLHEAVGIISRLFCSENNNSNPNLKLRLFDYLASHFKVSAEELRNIDDTAVGQEQEIRRKKRNKDDCGSQQHTAVQQQNIAQDNNHDHPHDKTITAFDTDGNVNRDGDSDNTIRNNENNVSSSTSKDASENNDNVNKGKEGRVACVPSPVTDAYSSDTDCNARLGCGDINSSQKENEAEVKEEKVLNVTIGVIDDSKEDRKVDSIATTDTVQGYQDEDEEDVEIELIRPQNQLEAKDTEQEDQDANTTIAKQYVNDVSNKDVLIRTGPMNHEGNQVYRDIVQEFQSQAESTGDLSDVSQLVIDHIHSVIGGRFLKKDNTDRWFVLPHEDVLAKVSKALETVLRCHKESLTNNDDDEDDEEIPSNDCGRCGRSFSSSRGLQLHQARCHHVDKSESNGDDDDEDSDNDSDDEDEEESVINNNEVKRSCSYKECIHCGKWDYWTRIGRCCPTKNEGISKNNSDDVNASAIPRHAHGTRGNTNRVGTQISLPKGLGTHIPDPEGGGYWQRKGGPLLAGYGLTKDVKRKPAIAKAASCKSKKRKSERQRTLSKSKTKKRENCIQYVPTLVILQGNKPTPSNLYYSLNNEDDDNDDGNDNDVVPEQETFSKNDDNMNNKMMMMKAEGVWTTNEHNRCAQSLMLHGSCTSYEAMSEFMKTRSPNQIRGYYKKNRNKLLRDSKKYNYKNLLYNDINTNTNTNTNINTKPTAKHTKDNVKDDQDERSNYDDWVEGSWAFLNDNDDDDDDDNHCRDSRKKKRKRTIIAEEEEGASWTDGNYCWLPPHCENKPARTAMSDRLENLQMRKPKSSRNIFKTSLPANKEEDSSKHRRLSVNEQSRIINPYLEAQEAARDHMLANGEAWNEKEEIVMI